MLSVRLKLKNNPFLHHRFPKISNGFSATMPTSVNCGLDNSEDLIAKIKERMNGKLEFSAREYSVVEHRNTKAMWRGGLQSETVEEEVCSRLCLVEHLQDLGVDRFFQSEIQHVLHHTFRLWQQKDERVYGDVTCRAMAFRLLRLKGYHVSPGELGEYVDEEKFFRKVRLECRGTETVLELYKASQVRLPDDDHNNDDDANILKNLHDWTFKFLKEQLKCKTILDKGLERKVEFYLKNYHGTLDAVKHRRSLDHTRFWKTTTYNPAVYDEYLLRLSGQDFMTRQAQNNKELEMLLRWYDECRLDKMEYGRNVIRVSHFLNANNFPDPRLSEARLSFAKTMTLVTRLDDFFDHHGSREDSVLIIELIRQWNEPSTITTRFPSEEVEILYSALHSTVTDIAEKAYPIQGRCIKPLIIHLWVEILSSFMSEMDSCTAETPPDIDEYLGFAWISIGCRICILVAIHFLGEEVSQEMVMGAECTELCRHVSSLARLLNDLQTFQKEREERKVNSVIIQLERGTMTEEEAVSNIGKMVEHHRKELLKMVVQREGSLVPKRCKDVFWKSCNIAHYLYTFTDEFTSPQQMKEDMKLLFRDPIDHSLLPSRANT